MSCDTKEAAHMSEKKIPTFIDRQEPEKEKEVTSMKQPKTPLA